MEERIAAWELERETCPHHGGPLSECGDEEKDWFPQRTICHPTMQQRAAERRYELLHEKAPYHDGTFENWSDKPTQICPFHFRDGVTIWVAPEDLTPDDDFLDQGTRSERHSDE